MNKDSEHEAPVDKATLEDLKKMRPELAGQYAEQVDEADLAEVEFHDH